MDKLNETMLEFAGFRKADIKERHYFLMGERHAKWYNPNSYSPGKPPDFLHSLDACFKWLVKDTWEVSFFTEGVCIIVDKETRKFSRGVDTIKAIALCLAIENMINQKGE